MPSEMVGDHLSATGAVMPALSAGDRLLQHLLIEFVADFLDVAGLLVAEQIAGAANIQIVRWRAGSRRPASPATAALSSRRSACAVMALSVDGRVNIA